MNENKNDGVGEEAKKAEVAVAEKKEETRQEPENVRLIKVQIEGEKKKREALIDQLRRLRNKLNYKQAEFAALSKLSELKQEPKNLGRLKRMKGDIEFKIATEAGSLSAEKELIKKLGTINAELEDALKIFRFKRKVSLVSKDIDDLGKAFENSRTQIAEIDKKLDELYANLREVTGWRKKEDRKPRQQHAKPQDHFEVSLEDIATIKNKKEDKEEKEDSD